MTQDGWIVRGLLADGAVRMLFVEARGPAERTRWLHGLGPDAGRLGAEALVAAALASAFVKGDEQLTLQVQGEQPQCSVYADVTGEGDLRVRVRPPDLHLGPGAPLQGLLLAIKHHGHRELYRGITAIQRTTLEQALASHLGTSDQVDTLLRIGTRQDPDGTIRSAGGLLLERLPAEPDLPSLERADFLERFGWVLEADAADLLESIPFGSVGEERIRVVDRRPLRWRCRCSQERIEEALATLGPAALAELADEDHGAEVNCDFCGARYTVGEDRLRTLAGAVG